MSENLAMTPLEYNFTEPQKIALVRTHDFAKDFFARAELTMGGHGFDHNQRVAGMAARLAILEGQNQLLFPVVIAALVFDIGRTNFDPRSHDFRHGQLSREMSADFLRGLGVFSDLELERIGNAIEDHPKLNPDVRTVEGYPLVEVLMDADRLDTIGALAPVRAAATRWDKPLYTVTTKTAFDDDQIKSVYQDFSVRVVRWIDSMWTRSGRKIAEPRQKFLSEYIRQYHSEVSAMMADFEALGLPS